jgi:hypothetical protein
MNLAVVLDEDVQSTDHGASETAGYLSLDEGLFHG